MIEEINLNTIGFYFLFNLGCNVCRIKMQTPKNHQQDFKSWIKDAGKYSFIIASS